ncbi:MAG: 4Fe-4S dicluster domain-containing protein [Thermodesulfobacteriota bacterium]|nr:4Fe-4S dicluster domain-containing protein [Thermodesulfobacteriota bacterium]
MEKVSAEIRDVARKLLEEDKVDLIIGFEKGSLPFRATPCSIRDPKEVERLIWNSGCENNLAVYIPKKKERIGIIAKGCDSRSLMGHVKEKQIEREKLVIIGVPCKGMVDRKKVDRVLDGREALEIEEKSEELILKGHDFEEVVPKGDLLPDSCKTCTHRNPTLFDFMIGDNLDENKEADEFEAINKFEARSSDERWEYFTREANKCIRCYACRNACPLCYCEECCVDNSQPQWFGKSIELTDTQVFHIMRAFHATGRCVDCGACVRACPMDVDLRFLNKKIEKDVRELYSFEAGVDIDQPPPLSTFRPDDQDEFIK